MSQFVRFTIDGTECMATRGQYLVDAAKENGIYIPTLCNYPGVKPKGSCRICTVRVNGKLMTACTTPVAEGMNIENEVKDINELRKSIIELLFVEGNHFCPACEKSGNCELQALAYRFQNDGSPLSVPVSRPQGRCLPSQNNQGTKPLYSLQTMYQGYHGMKTAEAYLPTANEAASVEVVVDPKLGKQLTDELAQKAMDVCPVGSIIVKEKGFIIPIGERKYDKTPIGSDIENMQITKI